MKYKIDYLSVVFKDSYSIPDILDSLGYAVEDFEKIKPRYLYNSGLTLNNYFNIFYNDKNISKKNGSSNTINIQITGQGCTDLIHTKFDNNLSSVFFILSSFEAKYTRIDIALDDFYGANNLDLIVSKLNLGEFRSPMKKFDVVKSTDNSGFNSGLTIYIGNPRASSLSLRIYDKRLQYISKNQILPLEVLKSNIWNRYELVFRKSKADEVAKKLATDINKVDEIFKSTLRHTIEFLDPLKNKKGEVYKNKSKWKKSDFWENFLKFDEKIFFTSEDLDPNFCTLLDWISESVLPSIKVLEVIFQEKGYNFYEILEYINLKKDFSKKQKRLILDSQKINDFDFNFYLELFSKNSLIMKSYEERIKSYEVRKK